MLSSEGLTIIYQVDNLTIAKTGDALRVIGCEGEVDYLAINIEGIDKAIKTYERKKSLLWRLLEPHIGHTIEIAKYGDQNISLEDMDTNEVIFDTDAYDLIGLEEDYEMD